jgi:pimeloyl-ACP methyl ester carboxylesterase
MDRPTLISTSTTRAAEMPSAAAFALRALLGMLLLLPLLIAATANAQLPLFEPGTCPFEVPNEAAQARLRCGTVAVPRDAAKPEAGSYKLAVAVKRALAPRAGAEPVVLFHGGPGLSIMRWFGTGFNNFMPGRDVILFDMRGAGNSQPALCKDTGATILRSQVKDTTLEALDKNFRVELERCRAEFVAGGHAIANFATSVHASDADAIRSALGFARWVVMGASYGATVAAEYVARYPAATSSAVIGAVYAPDDLMLPMAETFALAVRGVAEQCAADAACKATYGDINASLEAARRRLRQAPLEVVAPGMGLEGDRYMLSADKLDLLVLGALTSPEGRAALPRLLEAAAAGRAADWSGVVMMATEMFSSLSYAGSAATECRDRARHHATPDAKPNPFYFYDFRASCPAWGPVGEGPQLPVDTKIPMLVISGELDPLTPPAFGARVAARIGASAQTLTVPAAGHEISFGRGCVGRIVKGFVDAPDRPIDGSCLSALRAAPFVTGAVALPGLSQIALAPPNAAPPVSLMLAAAAVVVALVCGLLAPLVVAARTRRWREAVTRPRWLAGVAVVLLLGGFAGEAAVLSGAMAENDAVLLFGLPQSAWPVALIPWLALLPALVTLAMRGSGSHAALAASISVVVAVASMAFAGLMWMG